MASSSLGRKLGVYFGLVELTPEETARYRASRRAAGWRGWLRRAVPVVVLGAVVLGFIDGDLWSGARFAVCMLAVLAIFEIGRRGRE